MAYTISGVRPWFEAKLRKYSTVIQEIAGGSFDAENVEVAAGEDGLSAGDLQEVLQALATRIQAIEDGLEG